MIICPDYCGVSCIDGSCPKALRDEYAERDYDVVHSCDECPRYKGCEDCYFKDNPDCPCPYEGDKLP